MSKILENTFFHSTRELLQEHTAMWNKIIPEVTKQQYSVLCALEHEPGIEQHHLTKIALSSKATLAELLGRMEKKKLIKRLYHEADKRRRFIFLTAEGQEILDKTHPLAEQVDAYFLTRLSSSQQKEVITLLKKMINPNPARSNK